MPTNLTDVNTFTTPVAVPAGSDTRNAASVQTPFQAVANRTHYLNERVKAALGGATGAGEWTYEGGVRSRTKTLDLHSAISQRRVSGGALYWQPDNAAGTNETFWESTVDGVDATPTGFLYLPVRLPDGCLLNTASVLVNPGAARSAGSRMRVDLVRQTALYTGPFTRVITTLATVGDDGTTNVQALSLTSIAHTIVGSQDLFLAILSGNDGGAHNNDVVYAAQVTFSDPGPRNY